MRLARSASSREKGSRPGGEPMEPGGVESGFEPVRRQHQRGQKYFRDADFPTVDASIYHSRQPADRFEWMRPYEIAGHYRLRPAFFVEGTSRFDVQQGRLGDCWLLASIACLATPGYQELLHRVVPPDQSFSSDWYIGMFHFHFWHFGNWTEVIVDDYLPTVSGSLQFLHSQNHNEFWPALLEKAYAKLYGSYESLSGGLVADALTDLTGGLTESYVLRGPNANVPKNIVSILFKCLDRYSLIGCGIYSIGDGECKLESGLVAGHAYSVTGLRQLMLSSSHDIVTLIRVRNPWGTDVEWRGAWSDRSPEWNQITPAKRREFGLVFDNDGEFWMSFEDFTTNFDTLDVCNLTSDSAIIMQKKWFTSEHHGQWHKGFSAGGRSFCHETHWSNPQYRIALQDTDEDNDSVCSIIVQLMQKDKRKMKHKNQKSIYIGFFIYENKERQSLPLSREFFENHHYVASTDNFCSSRQVVKRFELLPGEYIIVPCTFESNQAAKYFLRIFMEKGNVVECAGVEPKCIIMQPPSIPATDIEDRFKQYFYRISGEDMELDAFELHKAINSSLKNEPLHKELTVNACKAFVTLFDVDYSGKIGYPEFSFLWNHLKIWKKAFYEHDTDKSGFLKSFELQCAIRKSGFRLPGFAIRTLVFRYAEENNEISLDNFFICMARLMKIFNLFNKNKKNDCISFTFDKWLGEALLF